MLPLKLLTLSAARSAQISEGPSPPLCTVQGTHTLLLFKTGTRGAVHSVACASADDLLCPLVCFKAYVTSSTGVTLEAAVAPRSRDAQLATSFIPVDASAAQWNWQSPRPDQGSSATGELQCPATAEPPFSAGAELTRRVWSRILERSIC